MSTGNWLAREIGLALDEGEPIIMIIFRIVRKMIESFQLIRKYERMKETFL